MLRPVQDQLSIIQNQLNFTSSDVNDGISTLEDEVEVQRKENEDIASLLALYAEIFEHTHAVLNQTVNDLSNSLQTLIDDAKKREQMKEVTATEATAEHDRAAEKVRAADVAATELI